MERVIKISPYDEEEATNHCLDRLLDPNQYGGPWFEGNEEAARDWMGDVFFDAVEYYLEGLGYKIQYVDDAEA